MVAQKNSQRKIKVQIINQKKLPAQQRSHKPLSSIEKKTMFLQERSSSCTTFLSSITTMAMKFRGWLIFVAVITVLVVIVNSFRPPPAVVFLFVRILAERCLPYLGFLDLELFSNIANFSISHPLSYLS